MLVMKGGELMGVEIKEDNISVSLRLPTSSNYKGKHLTPPLLSNSFDVMLKKGIKSVGNT